MHVRVLVCVQVCGFPLTSNPAWPGLLVFPDRGYPRAGHPGGAVSQVPGTQHLPPGEAGPAPLNSARLLSHRTEAPGAGLGSPLPTNLQGAAPPFLVSASHPSPPPLRLWGLPQGLDSGLLPSPPRGPPSPRPPGAPPNTSLGPGLLAFHCLGQPRPGAGPPTAPGRGPLSQARAAGETLADREEALGLEGERKEAGIRGGREAVGDRGCRPPPHLRRPWRGRCPGPELEIEGVLPAQSVAAAGERPRARAKARGRARSGRQMSRWAPPAPHLFPATGHAPLSGLSGSGVAGALLKGPAPPARAPRPPE